MAVGGFNSWSFRRSWLATVLRYFLPRLLPLTVATDGPQKVDSSTSCSPPPPSPTSPPPPPPPCDDEKEMQLSMLRLLRDHDDVPTPRARSKTYDEAGPIDRRARGNPVLEHRSGDVARRALPLCAKLVKASRCGLVCLTDPMPAAQLAKSLLAERNLVRFGRAASEPAPVGAMRGAKARASKHDTLSWWHGAAREPIGGISQSDEGPDVVNRRGYLGGLAMAALREMGTLQAACGRPGTFVDEGVDDPLAGAGGPTRSRHIVAVPMHRGGDVYGVLVVVRETAGKKPADAFRPNEIARLEALAMSAALLVKQTALEHQMEQSKRHVHALLRVLRQGNNDNVQTLLDNVITAVYELVLCERVTLYLVDPDNKHLWICIAQDEGIIGMVLKFGEGIAGSVAASGDTVNLRDCYLDNRFHFNMDKQTGFTTKSMLAMAVPGRTSENPVAVIQALNKDNGSYFSAADEVALGAFCQQISALIRLRTTEIQLLKLQATAGHRQRQNDAARRKRKVAATSPSANGRRGVVMSLPTHGSGSDLAGLNMSDGETSHRKRRNSESGDSLGSSEPSRPGESDAHTFSGSDAWSDLDDDTDEEERDAMNSAIQLSFLQEYGSMRSLGKDAQETSPGQSGGRRIVGRRRHSLCGPGGGSPKKQGAVAAARGWAPDRRRSMLPEGGRASSTDRPRGSDPLQPKSTSPKQGGAGSSVLIEEEGTGRAASPRTGSGSGGGAGRKGGGGGGGGGKGGERGGRGGRGKLSRGVSESSVLADSASVRELDFSGWDMEVFSPTGAELEKCAVSIMMTNGAASLGVPLGLVQRIASGARGLYHVENEFHNFRHGFSAMQVSHLIVREAGMAAFFSPLESFSIVTAALCHDLDHPGHNNAFEVATSTALAERYSDDAVLERHHAASCLKLLATVGLLKHFNTDDVRVCRRLVIASILDTDMSRHFTHITELDRRAEAATPFKADDLAERAHLAGVVVHCADLSGQALPNPQAITWSSMVVQEFKRQAALETELGLTPAPHMSGMDDPLRATKLQENFVGHVLLPLLRSASRCLPEVGAFAKMTSYAESNLEYFRDKAAAMKTPNTHGRRISMAVRAVGAFAGGGPASFLLADARADAAQAARRRPSMEGVAEGEAGAEEFAEAAPAEGPTASVATAKRRGMSALFAPVEVGSGSDGDEGV